MSEARPAHRQRRRGEYRWMRAYMMVLVAMLVCLVARVLANLT